MTLEERIELSFETLNFVLKKVEEISAKINKTKSPAKLQKLLDEAKMWGEKCDREKDIIDQMEKEGQE